MLMMPLDLWLDVETMGEGSLASRTGCGVCLVRRYSWSPIDWIFAHLFVVRGHSAPGYARAMSTWRARKRQESKALD
jgi:hypothetical protein